MVRSGTNPKLFALGAERLGVSPSQASVIRSQAYTDFIGNGFVGIFKLVHRRRVSLGMY